jgi:GNAT superfamily N-acetyltransferase
MWIFDFLKKKPCLPTLEMWWPPKGDPNPNHFVATAFLGKTKIGEAHGNFQKNGPFTVDRLDIFGDHRGKEYGSYVIEELRAKARRRKCSEFCFTGVDHANKGEHSAFTANWVPNPERSPAAQQRATTSLFRRSISLRSNNSYMDSPTNARG